jgi:hypothetical protein
VFEADTGKGIKERFTYLTWYATKQGYVGGFPTMHEEDYGAGRVYGAVLLRPEEAEFRDVPQGDLGVTTPGDTGEGILRRFQAANDYAKRQGSDFVGAVPTLHEFDYGDGRGVVYGMLLLRANKAEWRDVPEVELGSIVEGLDTPGGIRQLFQAVNDYARRGGRA